MLVLWCGFLLLAHFLCHVHPQKCDTKYEYKQKNIIQCCNKCGPGERMEQRCTNDSPTLCKQCGPDFYMDEYSTEMECKRCSQCTKDHMVYEVSCSNSNDAVCDCESGYKCNDKSCTQCEKIPTPPPPTTTTATATTTTTTTPASNTTRTTTTSSVMPIILSHDTLWITLSLCCVCILLNCFILISRHTPACGRIMLASTGSFWGSKKTSAESSQCTEDEEVPMPVQEVCGQKEWQEEV